MAKKVDTKKVRGGRDGAGCTEQLRLHRRTRTLQTQRNERGQDVQGGCHLLA